MQIIHHLPDTNTFVYQSGRFKQAREETPIMQAAYTAAQRFPQATSRLWKAAIIFESNGVELLPEDAQVTEYSQWGKSVTVAKVRSRPEEPGYTIRRLFWEEPALGAPVPDRRHKFSCECFDYQKRNAPLIYGQPQCKHILATKIALKKRDEAQADETVPEPKPVETTLPEAESDPEGERILAEARAKARRRNKGRQYERLYDQIAQNQFRMKQQAKAGKS